MRALLALNNLASFTSRDVVYLEPRANRLVQVLWNTFHNDVPNGVNWQLGPLPRSGFVRGFPVVQYFVYLILVCDRLPTLDIDDKDLVKGAVHTGA